MVHTPAAGDLMEATFAWHMGAALFAQTQLGFKAVDGSGSWEGLALSLKNELVKATSGGLLYQHHDVVTIDSVTIHDVKPATHAPYTLTFTPVAGSIGGIDTCPPQDAAVITWRTDGLGRAYRGRSYIPYIPESMQSLGTLAGAFTTALTAFADNVMAFYGPGGTYASFEFVVISRYLNKVKRVTPVGTPVTSYTVRPTVFTQRRRQIGKGM